MQPMKKKSKKHYHNSLVDNSLNQIDILKSKSVKSSQGQVQPHGLGRRSNSVSGLHNHQQKKESAQRLGGIIGDVNNQQ